MIWHGYLWQWLVGAFEFIVAAIITAGCLRERRERPPVPTTAQIADTIRRNLGAIPHLVASPQPQRSWTPHPDHPTTVPQALAKLHQHGIVTPNEMLDAYHKQISRAEDRLQKIKENQNALLRCQNMIAALDSPVTGEIDDTVRVAIQGIQKLPPPGENPC